MYKKEIVSIWLREFKQTKKTTPENKPKGLHPFSPGWHPCLAGSLTNLFYSISSVPMIKTFMVFPWQHSSWISQALFPSFCLETALPSEQGSSLTSSPTFLLLVSFCWESFARDKNVAAHPESRQIRSSVSFSRDFLYYQTPLTKGKFILGSQAPCHRVYEVAWSGRSPATLLVHGRRYGQQYLNSWPAASFEIQSYGLDLIPEADWEGSGRASLLSSSWATHWGG